MELKSRNPDDGIKQLRAGKHFVDYVLSMVKLKYSWVSIDYDVKYIIFHTNGRKNPKTRSDRKSHKAKYTSKRGLEIAYGKCNESHSLDYFI
ncbi:hypothetical protein [Paenibacillus sp. NPDC055715]